MATLSSINPFSNFTLPNALSIDSNKKLSPKQSKNFNRPQLDFTITIPGSTTGIENIFRRSTSSISPASSSLNQARNVAKAEMGADQALLGPLVLNGTAFIGSFSSHIRKSFDSSNILYGTENPVALAALGFTSGFGVISGGLNIKSGIAEAKTAQKISDATGRVLANLKIAKGGALAAGGAIFIPVRALTIAALATASKVCANIAGVLGGIGGACFNLVGIIAGISTSVKLYELHQFRKELQGILNDPAIPEEMRPARALEHLKQLATVSPQEKEEISRAIGENAKYRALNPEQIAEKIAKKESKLLQKKEALLKRVTGGDCLNQIRQKGPAEAKSVIEDVQKKSLEKVILNSIAMAVIAIGLAATVASFFVLPGAAVAAAVIGLATSMTWLVLDGYTLFKEFNEGDPGRFDKLWIFTSTVAAVLAVSSVFLLSGGLVPIIAASIVGAVWLGTNSVCYYRIYQFEKKKIPALPA